MHVVTTPLFLTRLLWVRKPHRHARCPKFSCWRPPLTFTHKRLMCLTFIMMTTYSVTMALSCSPMLFPLFLAQAPYHRLLIGSTKPPRLHSHSRFRVPSSPPLVPTNHPNHRATPPEFHFAPLFPSLPVEWKTIECNMASTGPNLSQRSSFSWTVPSPSFPVTIDTGATFTITPFYSDFVTGLTSTKGAILHGLAMGLQIEGSGMVDWNLPADDGSQITLKMTAYYVPEANRRLLSPQHYLQNSSNSTKQHFAITASHMEFVSEHRRKATIKYHHQNNLPTIQMWNSHPQREAQPEAMEACVLNVNNMNLTPPQKELLRWHFCLCRQGFDSLQRLLQTWHLGNSTLTHSAAKCDIPTCSMCEFAKAKRRPTATQELLPVSSKTHALKWDQLYPGQRVSMDNFTVTECDCLYSSMGKTASDLMYAGSCIFVDHGTGDVHVEDLLNFTTMETLQAKARYEKRMADMGITVKAYQADNGIFATRTFINNIESGLQNIKFSGVGAHHQNGIAERAIQSILSKAQTILMHAAIRWPSMVETNLWPMAVDYAVYHHNHMPRPSVGMLAPIDLLLKTQST